MYPPPLYFAGGNRIFKLVVVPRYYPPSFISRYLERLVRSLVYLPLGYLKFLNIWLGYSHYVQFTLVLP